MADRNKKVIKFHKGSQINIGVIIFLIILVYMLYNLFRYFTTERVAVYEVSQGTIAQNNTFTGVILREEKIFNTDSSGYITYYNKDATKVGVNSYVYSVDETGSFYQDMLAKNDGALFSEKGAYDGLEKTAEDFVLNYSDENFYQVYTFRYDMEAALMETISESALSGLSENGGAYSGLHACRAPEPGIVVYHTDGLENVTLENFTKDIFDKSAHVKNNLMTREQVNAGDPAFKLITSEIWDLLVPIDEHTASTLAKETVLQIKFKKDNSTAWGSSRVITKDGASYLALTFQSAGLRYATERYLEIELLLSDTSGLKIPNTALTEKSFFLVPKDYVTKGGADDSNGIMYRYEDKDGKFDTKFVAVAVAQEKNNMYYIAADELQSGDMLLKPDSKETYKLQKQDSLQGVYNINRGYAIFRKVEILFQNEEYSIVNTGTSYGISLYDHIALDAASIQENEIIQ